MRNSLITVLIAFIPPSLMGADDRVVTTFAESTEGAHGPGNVYAPDIVKHRGTWLMLFRGQGKGGHEGRQHRDDRVSNGNAGGGGKCAQATAVGRAAAC